MSATCYITPDQRALDAVWLTARQMMNTLSCVILADHVGACTGSECKANMLRDLPPAPIDREQTTRSNAPSL